MCAETNEIRTAPRPACLLCGSKGEQLYRSLPDRLFGAPGTSDFKRCPNPDCGLLWLDPAPVPDDLPLAYNEYFTHAPDQTSLAASLREYLYRGYLAAMSLPATLVGLGTAKRDMATMFLADLLPGKLLDVGCGNGLFLSRMRSRQWEVDGVDFDPKAIENAKRCFGLDLHQGDLFSVKFPESTFDAITLSHVIEHVPNPHALLTEVRRILKPGARAVLTTPNSSSFGHERFREYWFGLDPPRHLQVFSVKTLKELAQRAQFKVLRATSSAANADIFVGASLSIQSACDHRARSHPPPNLKRTFKSVWWQYREHLRLGSRPDLGEEAVLVADKR